MHKRKTFGRKAVKLSSRQRDLLENFLPHIDIPFSDTVIDPEDYFDGNGPLHLEIGFGNGEYTAALGKRFPDHRIMACEIFLNGIAGLLKAIREKSIMNIRIIRGDAISVLSDMFPEKSLDFIHINYPDPWPKKRHHKRRLIQPSTIDLIAGALRNGGEIWLSTDIVEYYEWMIECFDVTPSLVRIPQNGRFLNLHGSSVSTRFEERGKRQGREANYLRYVKQISKAAVDPLPS